jgi:hypothetical protein
VSQRQEFREAVLKRDEHRCLRSGPDCYGAADAHHVIREQVIQKLHGWTKEDRYEIALDPRIGVTVCRFHHDRLHDGSDPLRRAELPLHVLEFVIDHGLEHKLARELGESPLFALNVNREDDA